MDWTVTLNGDEHDLQELAKVCNSPELTIEKDATSYVLRSSHFEGLISDQEVREKTNELLIPINAGIKLELGASKPIQIEHTVCINPDGKRMIHVVCCETIAIRASCCIESITSDGKKIIYNPADPVIPLFVISQSDQAVTTVCQYINQDFRSWPTLYKIYEIIKDDGFPPLQEKTKNQDEGKYCKKAALFRRTANNPSASGLNSRHAIDDSPPEKPMSLSEGQEWIKLIIREWLETKKNNT